MKKDLSKICMATVALSWVLCLVFVVVASLLAQTTTARVAIFLVGILPLGGIACFFYRTAYRPFFQAEKLLNLYATGFTVEDIFHLPVCYSVGTDQALQKAASMLKDSNYIHANQRQAHYLALQNQINPHFLYNTLECIRSEAVRADIPVVASMTEALAKFFRYTISNVADLVSIADELDNIKTYFSIQQFRFRSRMNLEIQCPEDYDLIMQCQIPKLTLQPLLENAIIHGLEGKLGNGVVVISFTVTENSLLVCISDNGLGIEPAQLERMNQTLQQTIRQTTCENTSRKQHSGGVALSNVNTRIHLLFGENYGLHVESVLMVGTDVYVHLPIKHV